MHLLEVLLIVCTEPLSKEATDNLARHVSTFPWFDPMLRMLPTHAFVRLAAAAKDQPTCGDSIAVALAEWVLPCCGEQYQQNASSVTMFQQ
jgi:hypothetical protein